MKRLLVITLLLAATLKVASQSVVNMHVRQNPLFGVSTHEVTAVIDGTPLTLGADIVVTGGSGNYTYCWSRQGATLANTPTLTGSTADEYTLEVSDECDCRQTVAFHITDIASVGKVDPDDIRQTCVFNTLGVLLRVCNGAAYDLSGLPKGQYVVSMTDGKGNTEVTKRVNK